MSSFQLGGKVIKSTGKEIFEIAQNFNISYFAGIKNISSLPVQPMNEKVLKLLTDRGKIFQEVAFGNHQIIILILTYF
jgi:hypothetical protein